MSRTLYLHIGSHKTGTTSIQKFLAANRGRLAEIGFAYAAGQNGINLGGVFGKTPVGSDGADNSNGAMNRRRKMIVDMLTQTDMPNVIGSSESFSYLFDPDPIAHWKEALAPHFQTIRIISYLRRQDTLAVSHHQEGATPQHKPAIKLYGYSPTALPEPNDLQDRYMDYATRIGHWADVFGDAAVRLRVYDRAMLKGGDAVADFLDLLGIADTGFDFTDEQNVSMGFYQAKIGHILNEVIDQQQAKMSVMSRLPSTAKLMPKRADAVRFAERFRDSNRRLNARFHLGAAEDPFSGDFSSYPEEGNELWSEETTNQAIRACGEVINSLSAGATTFTVDDYMAAADALADTNPVTATRFLQAALTLRPLSRRIQSKIDLMEAATALAVPTSPDLIAPLPTRTDRQPKIRRKKSNRVA